MVMREIVERVVYPDETEIMAFDGHQYYSIVKELEECIATADGDARNDFKETLAEIKRRWQARQRRAETA